MWDRSRPLAHIANCVARWLARIVAASSDAQPALKQVLVLQSLNRGNLVLDQFTGDFRVGWTSALGNP